MKKLAFVLALAMLVGTVVTSASAITFNIDFSQIPKVQTDTSSTSTSVVGSVGIGPNPAQFFPGIPDLTTFANGHLTFKKIDDTSDDNCQYIELTGKSEAINKIVPEYVNYLLRDSGWSNFDSSNVKVKQKSFFFTDKGWSAYAIEVPIADNVSEFYGVKYSDTCFSIDDVSANYFILYNDTTVQVWTSSKMKIIGSNDSSLRTAYQPPKTTTTTTQKSNGSGGGKSSGGSKKSGTKTCPKCHGTGICQLCHGTGSAPGSFGDYGVPCQTWCSRCSGLGIIPN